MQEEPNESEGEQEQEEQNNSNERDGEQQEEEEEQNLNNETEVVELGDHIEVGSINIDYSLSCPRPTIRWPLIKERIEAIIQVMSTLVQGGIDSTSQLVSTLANRLWREEVHEDTVAPHLEEGQLPNLFQHQRTKEMHLLQQHAAAASAHQQQHYEDYQGTKA